MSRRDHNSEAGRWLRSYTGPHLLGLHFLERWRRVRARPEPTDPDLHDGDVDLFCQVATLSQHAVSTHTLEGNLS